MSKGHHCSKPRHSCLGMGCPEGEGVGETWRVPCTVHCARPFLRLNLLSPLKPSSELGYHAHCANEEIEGQDLSKLTQQRRKRARKPDKALENASFCFSPHPTPSFCFLCLATEPSFSFGEIPLLCSCDRAWLLRVPTPWWLLLEWGLKASRARSLLGKNSVCWGPGCWRPPFPRGKGFLRQEPTQRTEPRMQRGQVWVTWLSPEATSAFGFFSLESQ